MKKFLVSITVFFIGLMLLLSNAFASLPAVTASPNEQWRVEQNQANPANTRTQLGSRLEGPLQTGAATVAAGTTYAASNPTATCDGTGSTLGAYATPTTKAYLKTVGATFGESYCLGDGFQDQAVTFQLTTTSNSQKFTITPKTKTGVTNVQLTASKQAVTLIFLDSTDGWVVQGNVGATVN